MGCNDDIPVLYCTLGYGGAEAESSVTETFFDSHRDREIRNY